MNIGQLFGVYDGSVQNGRISDEKMVARANQSNPSEDGVNWKEGTVFKGEILNSDGEKVTIRLENDEILPARLQGDIALSPGDQLLFSVKENNVNQILIKPLFDSLYSGQTKVLEQALELNGLSPTEKNFSAAKALIDAGMTLDKGNMTRLLSQSMKFPETSMDTLVALQKMNIPVTEESIQQYSRYSNLQHEISADIERVVDSMTDFSNLFPEGYDGQTILSFVREITNLFSDSGDIPVQTDEPAANEQMPDTGEILDGETPEAHTLENGMQANESVDSSLQGKVTDIMKQENTGDKNTEFSVVEFSKNSGLNEKEVTQLIKQAVSLDILEHEVMNLLKNTSSPEKAVQNLISTMESSLLPDEALKQMLFSEPFKKLFSNMIQESWSLNPTKMKDPKEIDELYERIRNQSRDFENALLDKGGNGKSFQQNSQNMRQNMTFMEQINQQMIYAQMPIRLSNQNTNSELFVYADKRKLMEKKDGISVMLHLDMDHLGQTDVRVTLTKSNVHARFYLNDEESVSIVAGHIEELEKQLADRGFSLTDEVVKRKPAESINKVVDEIIDENAERSIKRYTFDAKT